MTRRNTLLGKMIAILTVFAVAGCGSNLLQPARIDYKSASKKDGAPTLDVPPDLSQISRDNRYSIPDVGHAAAPNREPLTASRFNAKSKEAVTTATPGVAINSWQAMHIEREGSQRWLWAPQAPEVLWPKVKQFWQDNGFIINQESQAAGVMETDWAENRAKIPDDFIRRAIGYVFDSLYSTSERDKFRTRLERRADGSTEIYISHRGVEEVYVGAQKDTTSWVARPNDPGLESAFLTRLMVSLGAPQEKAKELVSAPVNQPVKAKLIKEGDIAKIEMNETFDRAWRRVGLALDRVGFTVEDRDRSQGIYFVRYVEQDDDANKSGFFTRMFSSTKAKEAKRYRISVRGESQVSYVTVQNNEGGIENSSASNKILNLLLEQLK
jgi:outer membrane protein assembly factor BamC